MAEGRANGRGGVTARGLSETTDDGEGMGGSLPHARVVVDDDAEAIDVGNQRWWT